MSLVYQNNIIVGSTPVGSIKRDASGYYEVILGAFNVHNSGGAYYPLEPVKNLLLSSSDLMRRLHNRALRAEYGHPRRERMTDVQFLVRIMDIVELNTCAHINKLELDEKRVVDKDTGQTIAAMIGYIMPSGPHGPVLEKQFENKEENVCFSIRSITNDTVDYTGKVIKTIRQIVTWDYVNEPGIRYANKTYSPSVGMEGHSPHAILDACTFTEETILEARDYARTIGVATESSEMLFDTLLTKGSVVTPHGTFYKKPSSARWRK